MGSPENLQDDEQLMTALRSVAGQVDPVPDDVLTAARASFAWRSIDDELAELAYDSSIDTLAGTGLRGAGAVTASRRSLSFEGGGSTVELELETVGAALRLMGQIVPATSTEVEIRHPGAALRVEVDAMGRFVAEGIPAGHISLRWEGAEGMVVTPWLVA